jgi:antitoxin MazE
MRASVIQIGNSRGIRIPKALLEELHISDEVEIGIKRDMLMVRPIRHTPRQGWEKKFKEMHQRGEDKLLIDDALDADFKDWQW